MGNHYTQAEAAKLLRFKPEYLLEQMLSCGTSDVLPVYPSISFAMPVSVQKVGLDSAPETKDGFFELFLFGVTKEDYSGSGYLSLFDSNSMHYKNLPYELERIKIKGYLFGLGDDADKDGYYSRQRGIKRFITLEQDGIDFLLTQPMSVHLSELLISKKTLENYAKYRGIVLALDETVINVDALPTKKKGTPFDNTGRKDDFSLMTAIDACLQAFYWQHGERLPEGNNVIGEFVEFIEERFKAKSKDKYMENIVELKVKARGKSMLFIRLKAKITQQNRSGNKWFRRRAFDNQFRIAMKKFTTPQLTVETNIP